MLKHIHLKDIVEFLLFAFGVVALIVLAGFLESSEALRNIMWVLAFLAFGLWVLWLFLVGKLRKKEAARGQVYIRQDGKWVPIAHHTPSTLFDQDNYDHDQHKEQKA